MGKGSSPRPFGVDRQTFANNFDAIFGRKLKCPVCASSNCSEKHFDDYEKSESYKKCDACNFVWDRTQKGQP